MGKKGKWFGAVKKVFSPESKQKKDEKTKNLAEHKHLDLPVSAVSVEQTVTETAQPPPALAHPEVKQSQSKESKTANPAIALAPAKAEAALASSHAAGEVVRLATPKKFTGKSEEEIAAIKIQTAFRGHLARRALRALKGLVRLRSLIDGNSVKRQATTTLRCMQTLARVQSQILSRRIRMSEENQALQRQLLLKHERELETLKMGEEWDDSLQSKEQIEASLLNKQEAAIRRERALAYAFTHQWKSTSRSVNPMFMDPNNPQWGWSWLERWMAARPWDRKSADKELNNDNASLKSSTQSGVGEIIKAYARRDTNLEKPSPVALKPNNPASRQSPSTPKAPWVMGKIKTASPRGAKAPSEDDSRSMISIQSERSRRHGLAASSIRDDESLASSQNVPRYMAPTESAKVRARNQSLLNDNLDSPDKSSAVPVKKRLSLPGGNKHGLATAATAATARRHSGPPKVDIVPAQDLEVHS